jgi:mannose-6-phosphate isomerase-like protein (cupin superfamily)
MDVFLLDQLLADRAAAGRPYLEFIRRPDLSVGLYVLPAGGRDMQTPHGEDEAYYVVTGTASFTAGEESRQIGPGDTIFVAAGVPHRFHDIEEELRLIVAFGPAEGSRGAGV